jgi:hypothetical protein
LRILGQEPERLCLQPEPALDLEQKDVPPGGIEVAVQARADHRPVDEDKL